MRDDLTDLERLCMVTGHVSIHWAILEQGLDMIAAMSFHKCDGTTIRDDLPISLDQKLDLLKKSFRRLPKLAPYQDEAIKLLTDVASHKEDRHDLIHGAITTLEAQDGKFKLFRTQYKKTMHVSRTVTVDLKKSPALQVKIERLQDRVMDLALRIVKEVLLAVSPEQHP